MVDEPKPHEDDIRFDDEEYNPALEPKSAKAWLNLLTESEDAFEQWNDECDRIDRMYANLERLASNGRDREFAMFWANCEVLKPSVYAKPPVPVVVPKFKDRRPVYQAASEMMERCCVVAFDLTRINDLMLLVRDDLSMTSRGVAWCRYESGDDDGYYDHEKVCIDFKDRRDFLHSISRNWREVTWVAAASYMTRGEARKRFRKMSGNAYQDAEYKVDKDSQEVGGADARERAKFWEVWDKRSKRVVWVAQGCEDILDEAEPHLELQNFFPCPKPAYGTVQRGSLVPVPDVLQYADQLSEINLLTGRIHALADAIRVKGFYPAGGAEIADAVQTAISINTPSQVLVPISNWAAFGGSKEIIIWMPIDMIAQTVTALVTLRKQVIEDIYQIMGLSDIMRGATDPSETLGAQQLKTQYGSTRIRDKQQEMVRIARDLVEIVSEVITERFDPKTLIEMSQTQLPTSEMQQRKAEQIISEVQNMQRMVQQMKQLPPPPQQGGPQGGPPPGAQDPAAQAEAQLQQLTQQAQQKLQKMSEEPTIDQVLYFLRDNRAKSFVLDIETDSTIMADEMGEKQRRTEFVQVLGGLLPQLAQMIATDPSTATFCGDVLKFATAPFRAGRSLEGSIDELVEQIKKKGEGPQQPTPEMQKQQLTMQVEQMKLAAQKERDTAELGLKQQELQQKDQHKQWELQNERAIKLAELQSKQGDRQQEMVQANQEQMHDREVHQMEMIKKQAEVGIQQQKAQSAVQMAQAKQADMAARGNERREAQQFKMMQPPAGRRPT
jgi:hypothetical protein